MRIARRLVLGVAALITLGLLLALVPHVAHNARWRAFFAEKRDIEALLEQVRKTPPTGVDPRRWDVAWETTYNAFGNVCFSPEHVSVAEMRRLHKDIRKKLAEPPSVEWLRWVWYRLAQTGPHGKRYTDGAILLFDEAVGDFNEKTEKGRHAHIGEGGHD